MSPRRAKAVSDSGGGGELLAARQVSGLTTRQIARAAGVSDGVLYNYFASKNDLLVTALVRRYASLLAEFESGLPMIGQDPMEQSLARLITALHALVAQTLPIAGGLLSEPELLRRFIEEIHRQPMGAGRLVDPITDLLDAEREQGRVGDDDTEPAMVMILGSALNLALAQSMGNASADEVASMIPQIARLVVRGITP
jgi:AcrR family transcriptional regulator